MQRKSDIEMERLRIVKVTRSLIRLKHSLQADQEINEALPDILEEFDRSLQEGDLKQLRSNLDDILGDL